MAAKRTRHGAAPARARGVSAPYFGLAVLILAGVLVGALLAQDQSKQTQNGLAALSGQLLSREAAASGFGNLLCSSFFATALPLCAAFFCGLWAVGMVGVFFIALWKGAGLGLSMGVVYIQYGLSGFLICAAFLLPWALITSFAVVVACREGIQFSLGMARAVSPAGAGQLWPAFRLYCLRFVVCFGLAAAAALVEAVSVLGFSALFL